MRHSLLHKGKYVKSICTCVNIHAHFDQIFSEKGDADEQTDRQRSADSFLAPKAGVIQWFANHHVHVKTLQKWQKVHPVIGEDMFKKIPNVVYQASTEQQPLKIW